MEISLGHNVLPMKVGDSMHGKVSCICPGRNCRRDLVARTQFPRTGLKKTVTFDATPSTLQAQMKELREDNKQLTQENVRLVEENEELTEELDQFKNFCASLK